MSVAAASLLVTLKAHRAVLAGGSHSACHTGVLVRAGLSGPARATTGAVAVFGCSSVRPPAAGGEGGCSAWHRPLSHLCAVSRRRKAEAGQLQEQPWRRAPYSTLKSGGGLNSLPVVGGEEGAICSHERQGVQKFQGAVACGLVTAGGLWLTRGRAPAVGSVSQTAGMCQWVGCHARRVVQQWVHSPLLRYTRRWRAGGLICVPPAAHAPGRVAGWVGRRGRRATARLPLAPRSLIVRLPSQ